MAVKTHILKGTREEVIEKLSQIDGDIQKVVVIVEERPPAAKPYCAEEFEADLAAMAPYMSDANLDEVDLSREAMYERYPDE